MHNHEIFFNHGIHYPALCPNQFYSMSGYSPCIPCDKGFYQPDIGQMTCLKCDQLSNVSECVSGKCFSSLFIA